LFKRTDYNKYNNNNDINSIINCTPYTDITSLYTKQVKVVNPGLNPGLGKNFSFQILLELPITGIEFIIIFIYKTYRK